MTAAHRRHDITDQVWERLQPPGGPGKRGRPARDNRLFLDAVFWKGRAREGDRPGTTACFWTRCFGICALGAPWRDLPPDYGDWKNTHRRFCRWRDRGVWADLLDEVIDDPDFEWLMIDSTHIKLHPHGTGAVGGNQAMSHTKGG